MLCIHTTNSPANLVLFLIGSITTPTLHEILFEVYDFYTGSLYIIMQQNTKTDYFKRTYSVSVDSSVTRLTTGWTTRVPFPMGEEKGALIRGIWVQFR